MLRWFRSYFFLKIYKTKQKKGEENKSFTKLSRVKNVRLRFKITKDQCFLSSKQSETLVLLSAKLPSDTNLF